MRIGIISFVYKLHSAEGEEKRKSRQVLNDSSCIAEYLVRHIRQKDYFDCRRINFFCEPEKEKVSDRIIKGSNILEMDVPFDYFNWTNEKKQEYLYDLAYNSFHTLCQRKNWDFEVIKSKLEELKALNFCYSFDTGLRCTQNKVTVKLMGVQTMEKVSFYAVSRRIKDKKFFMLETKPNVLEYHWSLGELKWLDDNTVALFNTNNKFVNSIDLSDEINEIKAKNAQKEKENLHKGRKENLFHKITRGLTKRFRKKEDLKK